MERVIIVEGESLQRDFAHRVRSLNQPVYLPSRLKVHQLELAIQVLEGSVGYTGRVGSVVVHGEELHE